MKVSLSTFGGQAATVPRRPIVVDSADLSSESATELRSLVAAALSQQHSAPAAPTTPGPGRDAQGYVITIDDDGRSHTLEAVDSAMSPEFAALRDFLRTRRQG